MTTVDAIAELDLTRFVVEILNTDIDFIQRLAETHSHIRQTNTHHAVKWPGIRKTPRLQYFSYNFACNF